MPSFKIKATYWITLSIIILSILLEIVWLSVALDVGYLKENELISLLPWLIFFIFLPFFIAFAIASALSPINFKHKHFHRNLNRMAFIIALIIFMIMAMKKVHIPQRYNTTMVQAPLIASEEIFQQMKQNCIRSYFPLDGFNTNQILMHCGCIVKDSKDNLTLKEVKHITQLLATKETSDSAFLSNDKIAKIVIHCIFETDAQSSLSFHTTEY